MASTDDYRLIVRSNGADLLVTVEGAVTSAAGQLREVTAAAEKLGIAVRINTSVPDARLVTRASHPQR